jgi:hypothetical protein
MDTIKQEIMIKGKLTTVPLITAGQNKIIVTGKRIRTAQLAEEWYQDIEDPELVLETIRQSGIQVDIFTFWQRIPETTPKYGYYYEWEDIAVLPIESYQHWWENQIKSRTRGLLRKAKKKGVFVRETEFDDKLVKGMYSIFNEVPLRQGNLFWHYGKSVETIKKEFSRFLFREEIIGAYYNDELIGFLFLSHAGRYALTSQILSKVAHRNKSTNNVLIQKAVEICDRKNIPFLVYFFWDDGNLCEFKRRNGFEKASVPRYYIPLTTTGRIAIRMNLHHGLTGIMPQKVKEQLKQMRYFYHTVKQKSIIHKS